MNINTINAMATSVETVPLVSAPEKSDAPEKTNSNVSDAAQKTSNMKEEKENNFSPEEAKQLATEMNEIMDDLQTNLGFSIREDHNQQVVVEITDRVTKELIKQIPTEEMLNLKEKMEEFSGLLFDQKV